MRSSILAKSKKTKKPKQSSSPIQVEERVQYITIISDRFMEDLHWWTGIDSKIASRILNLAKDTKRDPFKGLGKPEPLKHEGSGIWSRRISDLHRLVYKVDNGRIEFLQCRYHYDD